MVQEGSVPVSVAALISVMVVEPLGVQPEEGVVNPPQLFELGGRLWKFQRGISCMKRNPFQV